MTRIGFIGFGNLGYALYSGLRDLDDLNFCYVSKNVVSIEHSLRETASIGDVVSLSDIIFLTIKPQDYVPVLRELSCCDALTGKLIVSPMAGVKIAHLKRYLPNIDIVRVMPNLAVKYKKSVTALCAPNIRDMDLLNTCARLLMHVGIVVNIEEPLFDRFTALYGSGPAFLLKTWEPFLVDKSFASENFRQLLLGTLDYWASCNDAGLSIDKMIENIASKGGTTEAGLRVFSEAAISKNLQNVLLASEHRAIELSK